MNKKKLTVAVTGLNAIDSPGPGVAVIRSLQESKNYDLRIIGLSYEAMEPGCYMKGLVHKTYQIPFPSSGADVLLTRLRYIAEKENLELIIPNFDAELLNFVKISPELKKLGISMFLPDMRQLELINKLHLFDFGRKNGLRVPYSKAIYSPGEIAGLNHEFVYPLVVKGRFYEAAVVHNSEQAVKEFHKLNAKWGTPIIIQEFVAGKELNLAGFGDGKGGLAGAVPMKKLYITDKGKAWAGITIEDHELIKLAEKFCLTSSWMAGFELEVMRSAKDEYFIMEINPRFPAWIYLATAAGQNMPEFLLELTDGKSIKPFKSFEAGKIFLRYSWDMILNVEEFQNLSANGEM